MITVHILAAACDAHVVEDFKKACAVLRRRGTIIFAPEFAPEDGDLVVLVLTQELLAEVETNAATQALFNQVESYRAAQRGRVIALLPRAVDLAREHDLKTQALWFEEIARLPYAMKRDQNGRPSHVKRDGIPVSTWPQVDEAWTEVAREIADIVRDMEGGR